jgi:cytochrome c553
VRFKRVRTMGWLVIAALPIAAYGAAIAQQEFEVVLRSRPDIVHGEQLFATCAACHGADGAGISDGIVPAIAGQHFRVVARELIDYRHDKRWDVQMEHHADDHNLGDTQDVVDVAGYVSSLKPSRTGGVGEGGYVQYGAGVYARSCAACHGAAAEGNDRARYPRLAGQHYEYLLRQMHDAVEGRRPNFPREHIRLLTHFQREDFLGVADYLSRLSP